MLPHAERPLRFVETVPPDTRPPIHGEDTALQAADGSQEQLVASNVATSHRESAHG
jgi:hypothetical protein